MRISNLYVCAPLANNAFKFMATWPKTVPHIYQDGVPFVGWVQVILNIFTKFFTAASAPLPHFWEQNFQPNQSCDSREYLALLQTSPCSTIFI